MYRIIVLLILFSVLAFGSSDAFAKCKLIQGTSNGVITDCTPIFPNGCFSGQVHGSLKGDVEFIVTNVVSFHTSAPVVFLEGETVLVANNGDQLFGTDSVAVDFEGNGADLILWAGGTGQFAGATGHAVLDSTADLTNMTFQTQWRGEICTP